MTELTENSVYSWKKTRNERNNYLYMFRSMARKNTNTLRTAERTVRYGWGGGGLAWVGNSLVEGTLYFDSVTQITGKNTLILPDG